MVDYSIVGDVTFPISKSMKKIHESIESRITKLEEDLVNQRTILQSINTIHSMTLNEVYIELDELRAANKRLVEENTDLLLQIQKLKALLPVM